MTTDNLWGRRVTALNSTFPIVMLSGSMKLCATIIAFALLTVKCYEFKNFG
jgi:hypothetical protein